VSYFFFFGFFVSFFIAVPLDIASSFDPDIGVDGLMIVRFAVE
jgi:hypothetical protein